MALLEEHLLRGRSHEQLEAEILAALKRKGLRVKFTGPRL